MSQSGGMWRMAALLCSARAHAETTHRPGMWTPPRGRNRGRWGKGVWVGVLGPGKVIPPLRRMVLEKPRGVKDQSCQLR